MEKRVLLAAGLLWCFPLGAQVQCALGPGASSYKASADQRPTGDAMELAGQANAAVKAICGANCPTIALFRNATAANTMLIAAGGQAKLVYAPQFFTAAYESFGDGGILAMIAHVLGHALDDTLGARWINSAWPPEVRADSWAGCLLAKMDLSLEDTQAFLGALAKYPAPAHPAWNQRLPAVRAAYSQCGGDASKFDKQRP